jgi:hypothetical protein
MKNMWKSKAFRITIGVAMVIILSLATALPAMANSRANPASPSNAIAGNLIKGKVTSVAADKKSFGVTNAAGQSENVTVDNNTRYYSIVGTEAAINHLKVQVQARLKQTMSKNKNARDNSQQGKNNGNQTKNGNNLNSKESVLNNGNYEDDSEMEAVLSLNAESQSGIWGKFKSWFNRNPKLSQQAAFTDLALGDGVLVKVMPNQNLAKQVLIVKAPKLQAVDLKTVKGDITMLGATSFTVTPRDTTVAAVTLAWDANSRIVINGAVSIKPGQYVIAVYKVSTLIVRTAEVFPSAPVN